jgi:hypothetical protein
VVHYTDVRPEKRNATIRFGTIHEFADGHPIDVVSYAASLPPASVLERAFSRVGESSSYDLFANNCEHFARWCKTGESRSHQVRAIGAGAGGIAGSAGALGASLVTVSAAGAVAGLSGSGVMSGLGTIGATVGAGAIGGVGLLAAVPGGIATAAVHYALPDDPLLSRSERDARQASRDASAAGAVAGTAASLVGIAALGVPGLSAAGITSGLSVMGELIGGGMVAGIGVAAALPVVVAAGCAFLAYRYARR